MGSKAIYEKLKVTTEVDDAMYDLIQKEQFSNRLTEYTFFVKKVSPFLN